ncbi:histidine phosphatase family protein [Streptomyces sp. NPDC049555]|uniref:histidine phosphatase family protein n=1 Tax=unclassified Streptomyces TaxID=2593676 RepID=UPI00342F0F92
MFVSPAMNAALRQARFDDGAAVEPAGLAKARTAAATLPRADRYGCAPSLRCRQTATALGLDTEPVAELGDLDVGRWKGRSLEEVAGCEADSVTAWLSDPDAAPHGGESVSALVERVGGWLEGASAGSGRILVVAEPAAVRAAMVHALGLPLPLFWRLDVAPMTLTVLTGRAGRWNLQCGQPL